MQALLNSKGRATATADGAAAPLRIALIAPPYFEVPPETYGGVEAVVADLADALVDRGHQVTLIGAGRHQTKARFEAVWAHPMPHRLGEPAPEVVHAALTRRAVQRHARPRRRRPTPALPSVGRGHQSRRDQPASAGPRPGPAVGRDGAQRRAGRYLPLLP
jgi:hypothetical protein